MPLIDILTDIGMEVGQVDAATDRSARISRVNKAIREIHEMTDLEEGFKEGVFDINEEDTSQVSFPAFVTKIRGMRYADGRQSISLDDMRNRYNFNFNGDNEIWYLQYRKLTPSCFKRSIENQSVITVKIPVVETTDVKITISGRTDNAFRTQETITIAAGELEKAGLLNFIEPTSAVKNRITNNDVSFYDVEGNLLGEILNSEYQSQYNVYQIADTENFVAPPNLSGVEASYKERVQPLKNDYDCYLGTDRYDAAIVWKFLEHRTKDVKEAFALQTKCKQVLTQIFHNDQAGVRTKINFRPAPFFNLPYGRESGYIRGE